MKRYGTENDLKTMIKELHKNNIEVILDVVYNHTQNPYKNNDFYLLDKNGNYENFSGCGNTFNCNSEIGSKLIIDSLIYFSNNFQIDGFRFDLASILTRGENGKVLKNPPILEMIKNEEKLKDVKFIAEPWDASGLYQLDFFEKYDFYQWNDKFRDSLKTFIRGDKNVEKDFIDAILKKESNGINPKRDSNYINYITCHDGFTLNDLVSYEKKNNFSNGENNKDGTDNNLSSNSGIEGPSNNVQIQEIRLQKAKSFLMALLIAKGTPMLLMGDEYLHTRKGNSNAWCQDNFINYFLWDKDQILKDFISFLIKFRKENCEALSNIKLDHITKSSEKFVSFIAKDFTIMFNSNDFDITINLDKKHKVIIASFDTNLEMLENKLTLKKYSSIILKKQD